MPDSVHLDKRRCQNRESQRRFRERQRRKRASSSWRICSANEVGPPINYTSTVPLPSGPSLLSVSSCASHDQATSNISSDNYYQTQGWLSPLSSSPAAHDSWTDDRVLASPSRRRNASPRQTQHLSINSSEAQFSSDEPSLSSTSTYKDTNYRQLQTFEPVLQSSGSTNKGASLYPVSLLGADSRLPTEPPLSMLPQTENEEVGVRRSWRRVCASMSKAEQMISDVEDLYEFGVSLSIFPEDLLLRESLGKMKERFRSLAKPK